MQDESTDQSADHGADHGAGRRNGASTEGRASGDLADSFLTASRVLVGLAVQSIEDSPVEVTLAQHRLLVLLAQHGDQTVGEIATHLGVNPSNATRHCDRLQRAELVVRSRSREDGRVVMVAISPAGLEVVAAISAARRREIEKVLDAMPAEHRDQMLDALQSFAVAAQERSEAHWVTHVW